MSKPNFQILDVVRSRRHSDYIGPTGLLAVFFGRGIVDLVAEV